jgi:hypothetical protein
VATPFAWSTEMYRRAFYRVCLDLPAPCAFRIRSENKPDTSIMWSERNRRLHGVTDASANALTGNVLILFGDKWDILRIPAKKSDPCASRRERVVSRLQPDVPCTI